MSIIRDIELKDSGLRKIDWVRSNMPLLRSIEERFIKERPFAGTKVTLSVHLEAKTAYLVTVLAAGGADIRATGSNPLSTQDDVAAALVSKGIETFAFYNATPEEYATHIEAALDHGPNIIIDDGGDLVHMVHTKRT
ncbi:MAG: adenosylhomocysteinase, partial [Clostridia bacterium]|nr:adenosylhomocysteinase [Clostridia bacterium]